MISRVEYINTLDKLLKLAKFTKELDSHGYADESWIKAVEHLNQFPNLKVYGPGTSLQHEQNNGEKCFAMCGYCIDELGDGYSH